MSQVAKSNDGITKRPIRCFKSVLWDPKMISIWSDPYNVILWCVINDKNRTNIPKTLSALLMFQILFDFNPYSTKCCYNISRILFCIIEIFHKILYIYISEMSTQIANTSHFDVKREGSIRPIFGFSLNFILKYQKRFIIYGL